MVTRPSLSHAAIELSDPVCSKNVSSSFCAGKIEMTTPGIIDPATGVRPWIGSARLAWSVRLAAVCALLATIGSWLGSMFWLFELFTHFRIQLAAGAALIFVAASALRCHKTTLVAAAVAILNVVPAWPYLNPFGTLDESKTEEGHVTRIMSVNVRFNNQEYRRMLSGIQAENPDIVGLVEITPEWIEALSALKQYYPYRVLRPEPGAYGLALFSRLPLRELSGSPYRQDSMQTAIIAEVEMPEAIVILTLAHLRAPTSSQDAATRNRQIAAIADMTRALDDSPQKILIGDLNATPWSPHFAQLETFAGLRNAARGRGYFPTWPTAFKPAGIPIDHILLSDHFQVRGFRTGRHVGSDHLPVICDVTLKNRAHASR